MGKKKILIVDNNPVMLRLMASFLEEEGHEVVSVEDSFSAFDALQEFTPQIIFLDLVMPKIAGDALCKIFRTIPTLAGCYIAIVSATVLEQNNELFKIGADAYIAKGPFSLMRHHILETIAESDSPRHSSANIKIRGAENFHPLQITSELLSQNRQLQLILESMSQGVLAISDNRVFYANPAALFLLQVDREHLLGTYLDEILDSSLWNKLAPCLNSTIVEALSADNAYIEIHGRYIIPQYLTRQEDGGDQIILLTDITDYKKSKNELLEKENKWKAIFAASIDPMALLSVDGTLEQCNQAFAEILDRDAEAPIENKYYQLLRRTGTLDEPWPLVGASHSDVRKETELLLGEKIYHLTVDPLLSSEGDANGFIHILHDITEQKQAEAALLESEERYTALFDRSLDCVYLIDFNGHFIDANHAALDLLGYQHEDISQLTFASLLAEDQHPLALQTIAEIKRTGFQKSPNEYRVRCKDGKTVLMETQASLLYRDGKPFAIQGIARNITGRKEAESQLLASQERYRALSEATFEGISFTEHGVIFDVNRQLAAMLGYDTQELIGKPVADFIVPEDRDLVQQKIHDGYELPYDNKLSRKDGSIITVETRARSLSYQGRLVRLTALRDITDRKKIEEKLKNSNKLLQTIINTSPMSIFFKDRELRYLGCNKAFARDAGVECPEDLVGKDDYQLVWKEQAELYRTDDRHVIESGISKLSYDEPQTTPEGKQIWLRTSKAPIRNETDEIIGVLGMYEDITKRKESEDALRLRESYLTAIIENQPGLFWLKDTEGHFLSVNTAFAKSCGLDLPELLVGKTDADIWPKELADKYITDDTKVLNSGKSFVVEEQIFDRGAAKWFETFKTPVFDTQGKVIGTTGYTQDITGRKQAEEQLRNSQTKLKAALASMTDAVFICDSTENFIEINEAFATFHRFESKEVCYRRRDDYSEILDFFIIDEDPVPQEMRPVFRALRGETATNVEYTIRRKDTGETWVGSYSFGPIRDEQGAIAGAVVVARDVTELKKNEEGRLKLEAQLQQAQKMESIGRLAGGVAHDFNNMLGVILGYSELALLQVEKKQPVYSALKEIQRAAQRSANLTSQLLTFARKQIVNPRILDLNATVESMLSMLRRLIGEDINLEWIPGKQRGLIKIDPSQVDQILVNLCVNSRDSINDTGKIIVETSNVVVDEADQTHHADFTPGEYVLLSVSDNGCGINEEAQKYLFEPFFTTKKVGKGTGLGLASTYGIVKQNSGFISVYSQPGQGTTFKIYFPRHNSEVEQLITLDSVKPDARGSETILLVEDEPAILEMTTIMLEQLGYSVLPAKKPSEAMELASKYPGEIQLLITDIIMPEMSGGDLEKKLLSICPGLKRLFMSGYTADVIAHRGILDAGVNFIQKPFTIQDLSDQIRNVLNKTSS